MCKYYEQSYRLQEKKYKDTPLMMGERTRPRSRKINSVKYFLFNL